MFLFWQVLGHDVPHSEYTFLPGHCLGHLEAVRHSTEIKWSEHWEPNKANALHTAISTLFGSELRLATQKSFSHSSKYFEPFKTLSHKLNASLGSIINLQASLASIFSSESKRQLLANIEASFVYSPVGSKKSFSFSSL
ncbi:hypothetical protein BpHYR1_045071 [Brachionus plicatilis]|uniref:Uncharacterized protein n=1 Tax=Brachionus plicatilis TaxID=10195 RepID=A0A3M7SL61_BRAPC|nr:hypothetical protein BpHYR1_045071 [Brachionus plicatilis]